MMMTRCLALVAFAFVALLAGCTAGQVVCGEGTIEDQGVCVTSQVLACTGCGAGTRWDESSGQCRTTMTSDEYCGEGTTVVVNENGVGVCYPDGMCAACDPGAPIVCPNPTIAGKVTICGRIHDVQTTELVPEATALALEVRAYDPIGFVQDPAGELPLATVYPDKCGVYRLENVTRPGSGFVAVATEDLDADDDGQPDSGMDAHWLTGVAIAVVAGGVVPDLSAFATRRETDAMWSMSAQLPAPSFAERGVFVPLFLDPAGSAGPLGGAPVAGVSIAMSGATDDSKDWYFADTDSLTHGTVLPDTTPGALDTTGPNGAGLWINGSLAQFSGVGGEPAGCTWPIALAATPPGVVFVQEKVATCN